MGEIKVELNNVVLYTVNNDYVEYLRSIDDRVLFNKPEGQQRPYVGFLIKLNECDYLVPLSSQIKKSNQVTAVIPNRLTETQRQRNAITNKYPDKIATIKFNNMIPVRENLIKKIHILKNPQTKEELDYKKLLVKEILFCSENKDRLIKKAHKTMEIFKGNKPYMSSIINSCCDFPTLENACDSYNCD